MAALTDKITDAFNSANPNVATVTATRTAAADTLQCDNLAGWPTASKVHFSTYQIDTSDAVVDGTQIDWVGIVSGNNIGSLTRVAGASDAGNSIGDIVEMNPTANWAQDLADALTTEHNRDGTHSAITADSVATNTITEDTAASGVTIDGLLIKDSKLAEDNSVVTSNITNDAVTATKIDWASTGADGGIWWEELGRTTLGSAGDAITVSSFPGRTYLKIIVRIIASGVCDAAMTFNSDSGNNYAYARVTNGTYASSVSVGSIIAAPDAADTDKLAVFDVINLATTVKLCNGLTSSEGGTAASSVPQARATYGKWVNTTNQITTISVANSGAGNYDIGSEVVVLGHN